MLEMKTLEELGISPAPWYIEENTGVLCAKSEYYKYPIVDDCGNFENNNDERLIAGAPELYKCLREAIIAVCGMCRYCSVHKSYIHKSYKCKAPKRKCAAKAWRTALAAAADGKSANPGRASSNTRDKEGDAK